MLFFSLDLLMKFTLYILLIILNIPSYLWSNNVSNSEEFDINTLIEQMQKDEQLEIAITNQFNSERTQFISNACKSLSTLPANFVVEFSKKHRINPNAIRLVSSELYENTLFQGEYFCAVFTASDAGMCSHTLQVSSSSPFKILGLSNVECL